MGLLAGTVGRMLGGIRGRPRRLALHGGHRPLSMTESTCLLPGIRLPGALASPVIVTVNSRWATACLPSGPAHDRCPAARREPGAWTLAAVGERQLTLSDCRCLCCHAALAAWGMLFGWGGQSHAGVSLSSPRAEQASSSSRKSVLTWIHGGGN